MHAKRTHRGTAALLRGAASLPAVLILAAAPAVAAPGSRWVSLCEGGSKRWIPIDLPTPTPARDKDSGGLCAHAACPRETRLDRKVRR
ncbi:hypothetical protein AB2M62_11765 [Sphingomonas sp. MMS12-HWE2-04]|uniref:hypothetical protein n=1 Tax=Sphingomonas sp. MMS12-HWE2-04 TaxID=3234199 RepID=UPI00384C2388